MHHADTVRKIAVVHALIDELNGKGVAISSVTLRQDASLPEFHGHGPIVQILQKYCHEISAAKNCVPVKVASTQKRLNRPCDIERLQEPLSDRSRDELRTHVFTIVKMWQNLDKGMYIALYIETTNFKTLATGTTTMLRTYCTGRFSVFPRFLSFNRLEIHQQI